MKKIIKTFLKKILCAYYSIAYKIRYKIYQPTKLSWDGSYESLQQLAFSLTQPIINRSEKEGSIFIQPPIFQKSIHGKGIDKVETFSRSFIGASYFIYSQKINTTDPHDVQKLITYYTRGIKLGLNKKNGWPLKKHLILENTSILIGILLNEDIFWSSLSIEEQKNILEYLEEFVNIKTYENNWLWCKIMHLAFLNRYRKDNTYTEKINELFQTISKMYLDNGWYTDGLKSNGGYIDYYNAWAMHYYGLVFSHFFKDSFSNISHIIQDRALIFAESYERFFKPGGTHPIFGRSQLYRFAAIAPFGYILNLDWQPYQGYGYIRRAFIDNVNIFLENGSVSPDGFLTMGVTQPNLKFLEPYSGSGSPYWSFKLFSLLIVGKNHPFWTSNFSQKTKPNNTFPNNNPQLIIDNCDQGLCLVNAQHYNKSYTWKYNKLVYSNIIETKGFNSAFSNDHLIYFQTKNKSFDELKIINSNIEPNHFTVQWSNEIHANISTDIIGISNGYLFIHQITKTVTDGISNIVLTGFGLSSRNQHYTSKENNCITLKKEKSKNSYSQLKLLHTQTDVTNIKLDFFKESNGVIPRAKVNIKESKIIIGICVRNTSNNSHTPKIDHSKECIIILDRNKEYQIKRFI